MTGFDSLNEIIHSARDNCKHRWIYLNGKNQENANMRVVHNLLGDDTQEESHYLTTQVVQMAA